MYVTLAFTTMKILCQNPGGLSSREITDELSRRHPVFFPPSPGLVSFVEDALKDMAPAIEHKDGMYRAREHPTAYSNDPLLNMTFQKLYKRPSDG